MALAPGPLPALARMVASPCEGAGAPEPAAGHAPLTETVNCTPAASPSRVSTAGSSAGLSLRWADSGTAATQVPSCQLAVGGAALSITPAVSGKKRSFWPCQAAGSPCTRNCKAWGAAGSPTMACACTPATLRGVAARAASNSAVWATVAACAGISSAKFPDSGMQTSLHTSHCASRRTGSEAPLKSAGTVTGTGSSSVPS